ncbi:MAG: hypothetical protein AAGF07_03575 [Patescibacteria group bacterium]
MSKTLLRIITGVLSILSILISPTVFASEFNPNLVVSSQTLVSIPSYLSSAALIQAYFESENSLLANYQVLVSFEPDASIMNPEKFKNHPYYLKPSITIAPYNGKLISVSELIWKLSTQDFGNSCSHADESICANNKVNTINPAFILAMIQKESGLVYGKNSQLDPNTPETKFLLDRVLGYYCFETASPPSLSDKQRSCYDENPNWKYFKGFFRQLYYAVRFLRVHEQMCISPKDFGGFHSNDYKVGKSKTYNDTRDGKPVTTTVTFENGITCAMYLYTPHVYNSQYSFFNIMHKELKGSENLIKYVSEDTKQINFKQSV